MDQFSRNKTSNLHVSASYASLLIEEKKTEMMKRELAEHRLNLADEHIVKITNRSRDLLYEIALRNNKFKTLLKRMNEVFPGQESNIKQIAESVEKEYDTDEKYLKELREAIDSQPIVLEESETTEIQKTKIQGRSR